MPGFLRDKKPLYFTKHSNKQNKKALNIGYPEGYYKVLVYYLYDYFSEICEGKCAVSHSCSDKSALEKNLPEDFIH